jgi:hypothetical protein
MSSTIKPIRSREFDPSILLSAIISIEVGCPVFNLVDFENSSMCIVKDDKKRELVTTVRGSSQRYEFDTWNSLVSVVLRAYGGLMRASPGVINDMKSTFCKLANVDTFAKDVEFYEKLVSDMSFHPCPNFLYDLFQLSDESSVVILSGFSQTVQVHANALAKALAKSCDDMGYYMESFDRCTEFLEAQISPNTYDNDKMKNEIAVYCNDFHAKRLFETAPKPPLSETQSEPVVGVRIRQVITIDKFTDYQHAQAAFIDTDVEVMFLPDYNLLPSFLNGIAARVGSDRIDIVVAVSANRDFDDVRSVTSAQLDRLSIIHKYAFVTEVPLCYKDYLDVYSQ